MGLPADPHGPRGAVLGTEDVLDRSARPPLSLGSLWTPSGRLARCPSAGLGAGTGPRGVGRLLERRGGPGTEEGTRASGSGCPPSGRGGPRAGSRRGTDRRTDGLTDAGSGPSSARGGQPPGSALPSWATPGRSWRAWQAPSPGLSPRAVPGAQAVLALSSPRAPGPRASPQAPPESRVPSRQRGTFLARPRRRRGPRSGGLVGPAGPATPGCGAGLLAEPGVPGPGRIAPQPGGGARLGRGPGMGEGGGYRSFSRGGGGEARPLFFSPRRGFSTGSFVLISTPSPPPDPSSVPTYRHAGVSGLLGRAFWDPCWIHWGQAGLQ